MSRLVEKQTAPRGKGSSEEFSAPHARVVLTYPDEKRFSLYDVVLVLVEHRWLILRCVVISTAVALLWAVMPDEPKYEASATVVRESSEASSAASRLGAIGNMFGVQIGTSSPGLSAQAYPDIMTSQNVRLAVVRDRYYISSLDSTLSLVDYLVQPASWGERLTATVRKYTVGLPRTIKRELEGPRPNVDAARLAAPPADADSASGRPAYPTAEEEAAMAQVLDMISVSMDDRTGMMNIAATTPDPRLSADLVDSFFRHFEEQVQAFYTEKARQDLAFVDSRLAAAESELREAEEKLTDFLYRNSSLGSAQLQTERERLEREVDFKSQMFSSLQAQHVQADVEVQRSKPVVTVMERPVPPRAPVESSPGALIFFGFVFGGVLGVGIAFTKWFIEMQNQDEEERLKRDRIVNTLRSDGLLERLRARVGNGASR